MNCFVSPTASLSIVNALSPVFPVSSSVTSMSLIVTFPLLVTVIVYVIVSPSFTTPVLSDVLTTAKLGFGVSIGSSFSPGVTGVFGSSGSVGSVAVPVALFITFPSSTSFSVTTYLTSNVCASPGASISIVNAFSPTLPVSASSTFTFVSVRLPSFVAVIL